MIIPLKTLFLSLFLFLFFSCAKKYTADNLPKERLQFGMVGGFTGKQTAYILLPNGQIFKQKDLDGTAFESTGKIPKDAAKLLYQRTDAYKKIRLNRPSDLNHFIKMQTDSTDFFWQWSAKTNTKDSTANSLFQLHQDFFNMVNKMNLEQKK